MAIALGGNSISKAYLGTTEIQKMYLGSELVFDNSIQPIGLTPVLMDFRVDESEPSQIKFNSPLGSVSAMTIQGFTLYDHDGRTLTGLTIASDGLSGYFTVSTPFNHFYNNSIDLIGGDGTVYDFTLERIYNYMDEPLTTGELFVDGSVSSSGDGSSEAQAFKTIAEGVSNASAGNKVWIKAVTNGYLNEHITNVTSGSVTAPIIYEGYKVTPGDITTNYYAPYATDTTTIHTPLDYDEMPTMDGVDSTGIAWINTQNDKYILIKNLQITNYGYGIQQNGSGIWYNSFIRMNFDEIGRIDLEGNAFDIRTGNYIRFIDTNIVNAWHGGVWARGKNALVDGVYVTYDIVGDGSGDYGTDYPILLGSDYGIVDNSTHDHRTDDGFGGHGIGTKYESVKNLIQNSETINGNGFKSRHSVSNNNVFKDCIARADVSYRRLGKGVGVNFLEDSHSNIYERIYVHDIASGIYAGANGEDAITTDLAHNNTIRNCIFENLDGNFINLFNENTAQTDPSFYDNNIYNNTIINSPYMFNFQTDNGGVLSSGNKITNNIVNGVTTLDDPTGSASNGFTFDYNNFFGGFAAQGTNTSTVDPVLVNFKPTATFIDIDAPKITGVEYDYYKVERAYDTTMGMSKSDDEGSVTPPVTSDLFPEAKGFGSNWVFNQDYEVRVVTNLNDSGTGSLRTACTASSVKPSVIVVFNGLSGTIVLESAILMTQSNQLYIAGQTSENGILLRASGATTGDKLFQNHTVNGHIIRGIAFAHDNVIPDGSFDNIVVSNSSNIIYDRCMFTWSTDENIAILECNNVTIQNSLSAEGIGKTSVPTHKFGALQYTSTNVSYYQNVWAHNRARNPLVQADGNGMEVVRCLTYNPLDYTMDLADSDYGYTDDVFYNVINNYQKPGANTDANVLYGRIGVEGLTDQIKVYAEGNINSYRTSDAQDEYDACMIKSDANNTVFPTNQKTTKQDYPLKDEPIITHTALESLLTGLGGSGTFNRNDIETRVLGDVVNVTGAWIDSPSEVGGYPTISAGTIITDSNNNGIPDSLESTWGNDTFGYINYLATNSITDPIKPANDLYPSGDAASKYEPAANIGLWTAVNQVASAGTDGSDIVMVGTHGTTATGGRNEFTFNVTIGNTYTVIYEARVVTTSPTRGNAQSWVGFDETVFDEWTASWVKYTNVLTATATDEAIIRMYADSDRIDGNTSEWKNFEILETT